MKKLLLVLLKIGISAAILAYLVYQAHANEVFPDLAAREKEQELKAIEDVARERFTLLRDTTRDAEKILAQKCTLEERCRQRRV